MGAGMNDYKELISDLRHYYYDEKGALDAADAIEQLVKERDYYEACADEVWDCCTNRKACIAMEKIKKERDAAIADLEKIADCRTCGNLTPFCSENPDHCKGYVWRGVREVNG